MKLRQIMTPNPVCLSPEATLAEAAEHMRKIDCGFVPVTVNGIIQGVITDRDIVIRAVAAKKDPSKTRVGDCMSKQTVHCFDDDEVTAAVRLMENRCVRRLPVLDRNQKLVGVVSLGDIAIQNKDTRLSGEILEHVSVPSRDRGKMRRPAA